MSTPFYYRYLKDARTFTEEKDFLENFKIIPPKNFNFAYDVADVKAENNPDELCVLWTNEKGVRREYTFGQLKKDSDTIAKVLQQRGISKGDRVLLILRRELVFWPTIMALHKVGAVGIPATHLLTEKDIRYRIDASGAKAFLLTDHSFNILEDAAAAKDKCKTLETVIVFGKAENGLLQWSDLVKEYEDVEFVKPEGDNLACDNDPMLLYFTSGTTGMPKMVVHNFHYPLAHIVTAAYWQQAFPGGLHFTISETGWAKSVWGKLYGQWLVDSAVFVYDFERFIPKNILAIIEECKVTTFCAPPTMYRYLLQEDFANYDLSSLKYCVVAGEPLNPDMALEFERRTGIALREAFGQTELTVTLVNFPWMKVNPGSMGKPNPIYNVDIIDEDGNSVAPGTTGEIVVRTNEGRPLGMFIGYYDDMDRTESVWKDNIYHTGDVAYKDEWGYYWYVGRSDDVIKSSGYRIGPFEVESVIVEHPAVLECAVTGVPDDLRGHVVKATIVLKPGYEKSEELKKEIQTFVKNATAPYKYPRIIDFVDEMPKTISGKIRRVVLRGEEK